MPNDSLHHAIRHLHTRIIATQAGNAPDRQLLELFTARKEEGAFEALVRRHGPMVLGVCFRVLRDMHDAEDAFQATFLVFARKATTIRKTDAVASWLYGVAFHTASKLRDKKRRSATLLRKVADASLSATPSPTLPLDSNPELKELRAILDAELNRLPNKYREPLILCYFEGKTKEQAAKLLAWPEGTVSGRLARGREMLRERLIRRGLTLSVAALTAGLSEAGGQTFLSVPLIQSTTQAAAYLTAGQATAAGVISASVAALTQGAMHAMFMSKVKVAAVILLSVGILGSGAGVATYKTFAGGQEKLKPQESPKEVGKLSGESPQVQSDLKKLQGTWQLKDKLGGNPDGPIPDVLMHPLQLTIRGDTITTVQTITMHSYSPLRGSSSGEYRLKIDPVSNPKKWDTVPVRLSLIKGAIYAIEGDKLTICCGGTPRPTDFAGKDSGVDILVFERENPKNRAKHEPGNPWRMTLVNGVTVELIGISTYPSTATSWWKPNGSPLVDAPYENGVPKHYIFGDGRNRHEFAIRIETPSKHYDCDGSFTPEDLYSHYKFRSLTKKGRPVPNMIALLEGIPDHAAKGTLTIRVELSQGDWRTLHTSSGDSSTGGISSSARFGRSRQEADGKSSITISHDLLRTENRLVAVSMEGVKHPWSLIADFGAERFRQETAEFNLPARNIKEFQLQVRPRRAETGEFKDVQLQPAKPK